MRLGFLRPDRPAADDQQMLGPDPFVKNGLVGEMRHLVKPRNRRHQRRRPGRDHKAPGPDHNVAGLYIAGRDEFGPVADDMHAKALEPFLAVDRRYGVDHAGHMVFGGGEIEVRRHRRHAKPFATMHRIRLFGGGDQRLRGHAAVIQAIAAHLVAFNQDHRCAHLAGPGSDRQAARTGPDDADIAFYGRHRLSPCHGAAL